MSGPCTTLLICHKDALSVPSCLCSSVRVEDDDEYNASSEGGTQNYYGLAHTITETVTEQASIMINGRLKEYQVSTGLLSDMHSLKSGAVRSVCVSASSKQHWDVVPSVHITHPMQWQPSHCLDTGMHSTHQVDPQRYNVSCPYGRGIENCYISGVSPKPCIKTKKEERRRRINDSMVAFPVFIHVKWQMVAMSPSHVEGHECFCSSE